MASNSSAAVSPSLETTQEQFLLSQVADLAIMLPITQLTEALTIPVGQIVPIPHMPPWVMGVYNWRGEILWMVDLGHLIGLAPWHQQVASQSVHQAIVLHEASRRSAQGTGPTIGLVVSQIGEIEWCNPAEIQSPPSSAVTPELAPFLRGYWVKQTGDIFVTLDGSAIMAAMPRA
ncbi:MAG: chemotaxis protein CheW [Cyanophyceae cyanobacterium]